MLKTQFMVGTLAVLVALADFYAIRLLPYGLLVHNILALVIGAGIAAIALWRMPSAKAHGILVIIIGIAMIVIHAFKLATGICD